MARIIGDALPNMPWENKPEGCQTPVWRYSKNPIIPRNAIPASNSVFNSAKGEPGSWSWSRRC